MLGSYENPFGVGEYYRLIYVLIFLTLSIGCVWTLKKIENIDAIHIKSMTVWGLGCITAAGLGNALDRVFRKEGVVDFMHFSHIDLVFNFADVFAYIGIFFALCVPAYIFINYKKYRTVTLF